MNARGGTDCGRVEDGCSLGRPGSTGLCGRGRKGVAEGGWHPWHRSGGWALHGMSNHGTNNGSQSTSWWMVDLHIPAGGFADTRSIQCHTPGAVWPCGNPTGAAAATGGMPSAVVTPSAACEARAQRNMCSGARVIAGIAWRQIQATVMTARRHLKRSSMEG
jgi:hypothetical protein